MRNFPGLFGRKNSYCVLIASGQDASDMPSLIQLVKSRFSDVPSISQASEITFLVDDPSSVVSRKLTNFSELTNGIVLDIKVRRQKTDHCRVGVCMWNTWFPPPPQSHGQKKYRIVSLERLFSPLDRPIRRRLRPNRMSYEKTDAKFSLKSCLKGKKISSRKHFLQRSMNFQTEPHDLSDAPHCKWKIRVSYFPHLPNQEN